MTRADYVWLLLSGVFMILWAALVLRAFEAPRVRHGRNGGGPAAVVETTRATEGSWRTEIRLVLWGFWFNWIWELAQSPLYADHFNDWWYLMRTRLHCTLGDVLILLGAFWATAALSRSRKWLTNRGAEAAGLFVGLGLGYTVWSEWFNTTVREGWTYTSAMPRVFGIGLSPILQWMIVPTLLVCILRREQDNPHLKGRTE